MNQRFFADNTARALLVLLLLVVIVAAVFISGASLHDPDTCWLLTLGKRIVESGGLPQTDPWSYTMELFPERRFILYQWLTEVSFFLSYKALDLIGLLLLAAVVLTASFVSIPLAFARKVGMPGSFAVVGTILTLLTAFFHFLCRPEIFSYLLLSIYICLTHFFLRRRELTKLDWSAVTVFGVVMAIWCNLHSGFVLGLLYLFVFMLVTSISDLIAEKKLKPIDLTIILSFFSGFLCSFINPYGAGLWQYLPKLFFTPLNRHIIELQPLGAKDFLAWEFIPFYILLTVASSIVVCTLIKRVDTSIINPPRGQIVFAAIAVICWAIAGFCSRRLIPFAAVHMFLEGGFVLALLHRKRSADESSGGEVTFWQMVDQKLMSVYRPHGVAWFVTIAVLAGVGVGFVATRISNAIVLPQSTGRGEMPFAAVKFVEEKAPKGRLYNDPQFGDVMIWKLKEPPKLFIDTRFDMYGTQLADDYQTIYGTANGWEALLERYKISWAFVRPDAPIAKKLVAEKGWKTLYEDKAAIIIHSPSETQ